MEDKSLKPFIEYLEANSEGKVLVPMVTYDEDENTGSDIRYVAIFMGEDYMKVQTIVGRQLAYDTCKSLVDYIDPIYSFIVPEGVELNKALNVRLFLKLMKEKELIVDDSGFEIDEYLTQDPDEISTNIFDLYLEENIDEGRLYGSY